MEFMLLLTVLLLLGSMSAWKDWSPDSVHCVMIGVDGGHGVGIGVDGGHGVGKSWSHWL